MRRAQQQIVTFPARDSASSTGALKTGLTLLASDVVIVKDGVAAAATNAPVELSSGLYNLTLTAAETNCGWLLVLVTKAGMRPEVFGGATDAQPAPTVVADAGNTATTFVTNLSETNNSAHVGKLVRFNAPSALAGQLRKVTGYNGTTKALTVGVAFSAAPAAADTFGLVDD